MSSSAVTFSAGIAMAASASANPKKRKIADVEEDPTDQEVAAMSRSERKRHREKKRRSDVNKGFDELMALLLEIDPEVRADAEERASKGQCKRSLGAHEENVLSRVDLIATAVRVMRRVNNENVKHKKMIDDFLKTSKGPEASFSRPTSSLGAAPAHHNHLAGLDRASLLQKSAALGLGGANPGASASSLGLGDPSAQLRAQANLLAGSHTHSQQSDLGGYTTADLLALRARSAPSAAAAVASRDAALLSQLNANREALQRNLLVQNMLQNQQPGQMSVQGFEALYGPLGGGEAPSQSANSFSITEGLYGALGGGARTSLQAEKEEQLRQLRAAGLS